MRDLSSRLRAIVEKDRRGAARPASAALDSLGLAGRAEASSTYVAGEDAETGAFAEASTAPCLIFDHCQTADRPHGRRPIEVAVPHGRQPISLFDARAAATAEWWRKVVYFDIETTGLSGGAGTLAFLAGCGWFESSGDFTVRQFFLTSASGERVMLDALAEIFADASLIVTYNGRTFDVPFMETRWAFHRTTAPTDARPHFDMLPAARRLWGTRGRDVPESEGCSLAALERRVLAFHRYDDVPGFEIPARYFHFLRTGEMATIEGVLEHNRHDLISLAALMSHALWLAAEGPMACREPGEQIALGRIYERAGEVDRAREAYEIAARTGEPIDAREAFGCLARLHRRASRHEEAARAWQSLLDLVPTGRRRLTPLERQAVEALAIHHEHRAKDLGQARKFAETLGAAAEGRLKADVDHRLGRISRKMKKEQECYPEAKPRRLGYDEPSTSG